MGVEFKTVQKPFNTLDRLTLQFMSHLTILFFQSFFVHFDKPILELRYDRFQAVIYMYYFFDYFDEKLIYFAETKKAE